MKNRADFFFLLALVLKQKRGKDIAILVDKKDFSIKAIGVSNNAPHETAIANVLQASDSLRPGSCYCISTAPPTPVCKGIADVRGGTTISFNFTANNPALTKDDDDVKNAAPASNQDWKTPEGAVNFLNAMKIQAPWMMKAIESMDSCPLVATNRNLDPTTLALLKQRPVLSQEVASLAPEASEEIFMSLCFSLIGQTWNPLVKDIPEAEGDKGISMCGNNVGAILVTRQGDIAWGLNMSKVNTVFHAETVLLLAFLNDHPGSIQGATLYTTLEPCEMCGALIAAVCQDTKIIFGMKEKDVASVFGDKNRKDKNGVPAPLTPRGCTLSQATGMRTTFSTVSQMQAGFVGPQRTTEQLSDGTDAGYQKWTKRPAAEKRQNPAPPSNGGDRGRAFAKFTDWLTEKREQLKQIGNRNRQQAAELIALDKCIEVLKTVAVNGLVTSYGIDFVAAFADEMFKDAKPAATLAAYNV